MKLQRSSLFLIFALAAFGAAAQGWKARDGSTLADEPDRQSDGDFGAWLILVDDEEKFLKTWATPSETVSIDTADRIERNKFITAVVVFSGCTANLTGGCDIEGGFEVMQPDGKVYAKVKPQRAWPVDVSPRPGILVMSEIYLRVRIEPGELLGEYTIRASLADLMAGKELFLESKFEAYESAT